MPNILAKYIFNTAREQIKERLNFDIISINPTGAAQKCTIPAMFIHGTQDTLVDISHSYSLMEVYSGSKSLLEPQNIDHNEPRPNWIYARISKFLDLYLDGDRKLITQNQDYSKLQEKVSLQRDLEMEEEAIQS